MHLGQTSENYIFKWYCRYDSGPVANDMNWSVICKKGKTPFISKPKFLQSSIVYSKPYLQ